MVITINNQYIGDDCPCYIISEMSANHCQRFENSVELIKSAKLVGANAVKVQLYTPGTTTLPIETGDFYMSSGLWKGVSLWRLYEKTYMPWEWYQELLKLAESLELTLFPTVLDLTALEFAEKYDTPAYKIASFEIGDRGLLKAVVATGKPVFISTGCATTDDFAFIDSLNSPTIILLHCVSEYPSTASALDLDAACLDLDGISDHTVGIGFPILCAINGALVVEKHMWLGTGDCADREFSLTPGEFKTMVDAIRGTEAAGLEFEKRRGQAHTGENFQRSVYVAGDIKKGDVLTRANIRLVRPGYGLDPRLYEDVLGKTATMDMPYGTALKETYYQ